jgi:O-antigen ligase
LVAVLLLFIPYIKILGILGLLAWVGLLGCFVKQARDGTYKRDLNAYRGAIFPSLGNWVVSLFELSFDDSGNAPVA